MRCLGMFPNEMVYDQLVDVDDGLERVRGRHIGQSLAGMFKFRIDRRAPHGVWMEGGRIYAFRCEGWLGPPRRSPSDGVPRPAITPPGPPTPQMPHWDPSPGQPQKPIQQAPSIPRSQLQLLRPEPLHRAPTQEIGHPTVGVSRLRQPISASDRVGRVPEISHGRPSVRSAFDDVGQATDVVEHYRLSAVFVASLGSHMESTFFIEVDRTFLGIQENQTAGTSCSLANAIRWFIRRRPNPFPCKSFRTANRPNTIAGIASTSSSFGQPICFTRFRY